MTGISQAGTTSSGSRLPVRHDVGVLQEASWWTRQRSLHALRGMGALAVLGLGWAGLLRRQVRAKTRIIERQREEESRLKEAAEAARHAKNEFLANMSHEIRTPLNGICGMTALALSVADNEEQCGYLRLAQESAQALMRVINDILDLSRVEAGKLVLAEAPFRLPEQIEAVVSVLGVAAAQKGLRLERVIHPNVPEWVYGDAPRLRQILLNLLGNAIKFTERGRAGLEVRVDAGGFIQFEVADTGPGIDAPHLDRIFGAFERVDTSARRRHEGTGLGLAISRRLAGLMGGRLWAESEEGRGSRFHLALPLPTAVPPPAPVPAEPENAPERRKLRVLVAEDNHINQVLIEKLVTRLGHFVRITGDGQEALEAMTNGEWDAVLMDVHMPRMDGLEATQRIRVLERTAGRAHTPVLALTARVMEQDQAECRQAGMDGHLPKPVELAALRHALDRIARHSVATE